MRDYDMAFELFRACMLALVLVLMVPSVLDLRTEVDTLERNVYALNKMDMCGAN